MWQRGLTEANVSPQAIIHVCNTRLPDIGTKILHLEVGRERKNGSDH